MTPQELRDTLILSGVRANILREEVRIQTCIFCGNTKYNLEANPAAGVYHCWACNAGGRVDSLLRQITGIAVSIPVTLEQRERSTTRHASFESGEALGPPAADVPWTLTYLQQRRLTVIDAALYQIRAGEHGPYKDRVVFPVLEYWSRQLAGYIGRTIVGAFPRYYSGWVTPEKCVVGYRTRSTVHVLVEGVLDGIRVHKAGFNAAIMTGTAFARIDEWAARVPEAHNVVVLLDGDAAEAAQRLYWRIQPIHPRLNVVTLPAEMDPAMLDERVVETLIHHVLKGNTSAGRTQETH